MIRTRIERLETKVRRMEASQRGTAAVPRRRLQTAQDVIDLLEEQVEAVRADAEASTLEKARAIGYLAAIARKAIETANLAAHITMLEAVLKRRPEERRQ
jgi:hypothetical protein